MPIADSHREQGPSPSIGAYRFSMTKYFAGIGSRKTPQNILELITTIAQVLATKGYTLRSGGADGADKAFESGAILKEILRPKHATPQAIQLAMSMHPNPNACNDYVRKLHGRNAQIILGPNLDTIVDFVVCYSKNENAGGTSLGIKIARQNSIPVFNIFNPHELLALKKEHLNV